MISPGRYHHFPGSVLVSAIPEHGLRYAYHLLRERLALRKGRRADMRPHLRARLNLAGRRHGTGVSALLQSVGRQDIGELDYDLLAQQGERGDAVFGRLSLAETMDLFTYFRYFGDFRTASLLRTRALEAHLREQARVEHVLPAALAAALEQGRPELVLEIVDTKPTRSQDRSGVAEVTAVAHALRGDGEQAQRMFSQTFSARDRLYGDALRGRSVALVGPSPASADLAQEIDAFDLVARTNYLGQVDRRYGSRTDISYYNGARIVSRRDEICALAPTLKWLVAVRSDDTLLRQMLPAHPGIRPVPNPAPIFLSPNPLAIPTILNDLIRFQPRRIRLFGIDFFSSASAYGKQYHAHVVGSDAISHSIRVHDCFGSFRFVQQLKQAGLCEADARVDEVLSMSREQYAARLQEAHGHCTVENENPQKKWRAKPPGG